MMANTTKRSQFSFGFSAISLPIIIIYNIVSADPITRINIANAVSMVCMSMLLFIAQFIYYSIQFYGLRSTHDATT